MGSNLEFDFFKDKEQLLFLHPKIYNMIFVVHSFLCPLLSLATYSIAYGFWKVAQKGMWASGWKSLPTLALGSPQLPDLYYPHCNSIPCLLSLQCFTHLCESMDCACPSISIPFYTSLFEEHHRLLDVLCHEASCKQPAQEGNKCCGECAHLTAFGDNAKCLLIPD